MTAAEDGESSAGRKSSSKLSKNLLQMKFMKRSALKEEEQEQKQQRKVIADAEHWSVPDLGERVEHIIVKDGYGPFENLQYGRMSFRGFNPTVERLMKEQKVKLASEEIDLRENEMTISDKEMAERYGNLVHTIKNKFAKNERKRGCKAGKKHNPKYRQNQNSKESSPESMQSEKVEKQSEEKSEEPECSQTNNKAKLNRKRSKGKAVENDSEDPSPSKKAKREFKKPSD